MSFLACFSLVTSEGNGKLEAPPSVDGLALMGKRGKLETLPLFIIHRQSLLVHAVFCCPNNNAGRVALPVFRVQRSGLVGWRHPFTRHRGSGFQLRP
mmetsp:Transcript_16789/g.24856  ORF Transcript_16789/g.24856 Transcript_16789/m.24856 type:complete len:97 (+) Transcript_16789:440-730(+)